MNEHINDFNPNDIEALDSSKLTKEAFEETLAEAHEGHDHLDVRLDAARLSQRDLRALAFHFVYAVEGHDYTASLESVVDMMRRGYDLDVANDSRAVSLARTAIDQRVRYDEELRPFLRNWKIERLGCCTRLILRLALAELEEEGAIPTIVLNEAVELAKSFAERDAYKFVNGVLDELVKSRGLKDPEQENDDTKPSEDGASKED